MFSDFVSEKSESSQKNVFNDEWVFQSFFGSLLFSVGFNKSSPSECVFSVNLLLKESCKFRNTFKFSDLVFEDLISHQFKEFFLLSSFVFDFLFNDFGQFSGKFDFIAY